MGTLDTITKYLVETSYNAFADDVVEATKKQKLDILGVMVAGSTCSISGEINEQVDLVKE